MCIMVMRKWTILACVIAILVLVAYAFMRGMTRTAHKFEVTKQCVALQAIYKGWISAGKPHDYDPSRWVVSNTASYSMHTNTYQIKQKKYESLAAAYASSLIDEGVLVICKDGRLLWVPNPELIDYADGH